MPLETFFPVVTRLRNDDMDILNTARLRYSTSERDGTSRSDTSIMGTTKRPAAFMASFLAVALVFLGLMPNGVHGKNMKFSRTLSFDEDLGGALKDLMGDLANSEKANKAGGQCAFECDNGAKPVKRKGYYPVSDGCMVRTMKRTAKHA